MAKYRVQGPDGKVHVFEGPDGASPADIEAFANQTFGAKAQRAKADKADMERMADPTAGMSTTDKFLAGMGKAFADTGRGVGQLVRDGIEVFDRPAPTLSGLITGKKSQTLADKLGLPSTADIDESKKLDSSLMNTGAGQAGNFAGNVAITLPTVAVPGAATLRGAATIGALQGAIGPVGTDDSRVQNMLLGGAAGAGGVAAGRVLAGAYQGGKALIEPFTQGGRQKIAGRVIQRFADDPAAVAAAKGGKSVTGATPTIAEETADAGMARLQDAVRSVDPQIAGRIDARLADNNAARVEALRSLTGSDGGREFAVEMRKGTTKPMYDAATSLGIDFDTLSAAQKGEMTKVMQMPAVQDALGAARENAANHGMKIGNEGNVAGLHQAKMAMDDKLRDLANQGLGDSNKAQAIRAAKDRLVTFMDSMTGGAYGEARQTFAEMSKPINQMDVVQAILNKGSSATSDLAGNPRLMPNALTSIVKTPEAEAALIKQATGGKAGVNRIADILTPEQNNLVRSVINEVDRTGAVARAGNGPGSATAQRMAAQNVLARLIGPTGLPTSWAESAIANTIVGKPLNLLYGGIAEPKIQQELANAVLDPATARQALLAAQKQGIKLPQNMLTELIGQAARTTPSSLVVSQPGGR